MNEEDNERECQCNEVSVQQSVTIITYEVCQWVNGIGKKLKMKKNV
jgi:hypothetical protein